MALVKPTISGASRKIMSSSDRPMYPYKVDNWERRTWASMELPAAVIAAWNLNVWNM